MSCKISVIVATLNSAGTLQRCINSIAEQTYNDKELIVKDGNSHDDTKKIIKKNSHFISYWVSEPDSGIYDAWNQALSRCRGEWICFLGADDFFFKPDVLRKIVKKLEKVDKNIRVVYGQNAVINQKGQLVEVNGQPWEHLKNRFKQIMCIPHPGTMHHRSLFQRHGNFNTRFKIAGDYELLLRELKSGDAVFIPELICGFSVNGISSNPSNMLESLIEVRTAQKLHLQSQPGLIWIAALLRAYIRLILWRSVGENITRRLLDFGRRLMGKPQYWTVTG